MKTESEPSESVTTPAVNSPKSSTEEQLKNIRGKKGRRWKNGGKRKREFTPDDRTQEERDAQKRPKAGPKRKMAILVGYLGAGYQGLQRNPGVKTIEAELENAICEAGGIDEFNAHSFQKVSWQRCARTDKGVHALGNIISLKISNHVLSSPY